MIETFVLKIYLSGSVYATDIRSNAVLQLKLSPDKKGFLGRFRAPCGYALAIFRNLRVCGTANSMGVVDARPETNAMPSIP